MKKVLVSKLCCPHKSCGRPLALKFSKRAYHRIGQFITKWNHQPVPRYQCLYCKKGFSTHTFKSTYKQKRPDLNQKIYRLYCSGMTQRRIAKELKCNLKTVVRKILFMAKKASEVHKKSLEQGSFELSSLQFDEMESFEHTRLKPLSIALAVSGEGRKIIDFSVGTLSYKGRLATLAFNKYGPRIDTSKKARLKVLKSVAKLSSSKVIIKTDAKPHYKMEIKRIVKNAEHLSFKNQRNQTQFATKPLRRKNVADPLFWFNHVAARIRNDLSRMMRKTWTTTKKKERLEAHLMLFVAYYNQYSL